MVLVITVNYRTPQLTLECLRSLRSEAAADPRLRVVVVDNDSGDGSAEIIETAITAEGLDGWSTLVRSPINGGFARGNNLGLTAATEGRTPWGPVEFEFVWLLNPDTYVRPGVVKAALHFFESRPEAGILGTRVENADGSVWLSASHFPSVWSELDHALAFGPFTRLVAGRSGLYPPADAPRKVDWVSGASLFVRHDVIRRLGFLDEGYFMYYEETDFCLAARRAGIECWQIQDGRIVHLLGKSSGVTGEQAGVKRRPRYWFDSRARYFRKNHGAAYLHVANALWCLLYPIGSLQRRLRGKPRNDPPFLWWDMFRHSLPGPHS